MVNSVSMVICKMILIIGMTCGMNTEPKSATLVTGSIVEHLEPARLVEGIIKLEVHIRAPQWINTHLYKYLAQLLKITESAKAYSKLQHSKDYFTAPVDTFSDMIVQEIYILHNRLIRVCNFEWINESRMKDERRKRGAIDVGGNILQALFGVAIDKDVKVLNKKLNLVEMAMKESQMALTSFVHDHEKIAKHIKGLEESLKEKSRILEGRWRTETVFDNLIIIRAQCEQIDRLVSYLEGLDLEIRRLMAGVKTSSLHYLPERLISLSTLIKLNEESEDQLEMRSIVPLTKESLSQYLSVMHIFPLLTDFGIICTIPFAKEIAYKAYQFHPFPTYHSSQNKYRIYLKFRLPVVLISNDLKTLTQMSEQEFSLCSRVFIPLPTYVCYVSHPMFVYPLDRTPELTELICQEQIIRSNSTSECVFQPYNLMDTFVQRVQQRMYISGTTSQRAIIHCTRGHVKTMLQPLAILNPGCSLSAQGINLANIVELKANIALSLPVLPMVEMEAMTFNGKHPNEPNNTEPILELPLHTAEILTHVNNVKQYLEKAAATPSMTPVTLVTSTTVFGTLIVGMIICLYRKLRVPAPVAPPIERVPLSVRRDNATSNTPESDYANVTPEALPRRNIRVNTANIGSAAPTVLRVES